MPNLTTVATASDETLLIPEDDVDAPQLSIVIPALNEELTITDFVAWCREGLAAAGVTGEILIVDSSTDQTPELAQAAGARVLRVPKRGLGRAYMDAIPYIRGDWVLMGDADCTYDFRLLAPFVEKFQQGYEYVMGSRWKGSIEPGAMPPLHQYFGTPVTTWILNRLFSSQFSDIHCGMRGITRDALVRMDLHSESWEYASEMVLKSVQMELRTDRGAGPVPRRSRGAAQPSQALGLVLAVAGGVDQPARDVHLRLGLLRVQARDRAGDDRA